MAKPNYRHEKKQKEAARKARQDAKQQRRAQTPDVPVEGGAKDEVPAGGDQPASS